MRPSIVFHNTLPEGAAPSVAAIAARMPGAWLLMRDHHATKPGLPFTGVGESEKPLEAAKRCLEGVGMQVETLERVCFFTLPDINRAGSLFFARISSVAESYAVVNAAYFPKDTSPLEALLFDRAQQWVNTQSGKGEPWDLYGRDRRLLGKTHKRGDPQAPGEFRLVVHVWIQNRDGEFLITKRTENKGYPLMWECTGGSVLAGEASQAAALREVREEAGLALDEKLGKIVLHIAREDYLLDVWLFNQDFALEDVRFQQGETCDAKWASAGSIRDMAKAGVFIDSDYLDAFLDQHGQLGSWHPQ